MPSSRLLAPLLAVLTLALPARAHQSLQVVGWSADEQRFAVRRFELEEGDPSMGDDEESFCPGYVDHEGKKFRGALKLAVYEKGKQLATYSIQDAGTCTPPKLARARLDRAKQELAKLGIDLKQKEPGTELLPGEDATITVSEGPGAPYTLEAEEQVKETNLKGRALTEEEENDAHSERRVKGQLLVFLNQGGKRRQVLSQKVDGSYTPMMAGHHWTKLARVWLSPGGRTVVVISETSSGNMRGASQSLDVMGVLSWSGTPLVLR
jgi:hypothetical protein